MSTHRSIAYSSYRSGERYLAFHIYTDLLDPEPVFIGVAIRDGEVDAMQTIALPCEEVLKMADDMTKWAKRIRTQTRKKG